MNYTPDELAARAQWHDYAARRQSRPDATSSFGGFDQGLRWLHAVRDYGTISIVTFAPSGEANGFGSHAHWEIRDGALKGEGWGSSATAQLLRLADLLRVAASRLEDSVASAQRTWAREETPRLPPAPVVVDATFEDA